MNDRIPYNHITLLIGFMNELMRLARIQNRIDKARKRSVDDPEMMTRLDELQTNVVIKKVKIQDEMFEISRSN